MNDYLTAVEILKEEAGAANAPLEGFNKRDYLKSFEQRYQHLLPAFDAIERLYHEVGEPDTMLDNMAVVYTEMSQTILENASRRKREQVKMDLNMHLAVYVFPAILHYAGDSSRPLSSALETAWQKAFPGSNVRAAELEQIEAGFHKKFCYITTAVCQMQGKADDCYELNLLRSYRDGYLAARPDGGELIRRYYDVAPSIVKHIDKRADRDSIYHSVWEAYLAPCISLIEHGEDEACAMLYEQMVDTLKKDYFYTT